MLNWTLTKTNCLVEVGWKNCVRDDLVSDDDSLKSRAINFLLQKQTAAVVKAVKSVLFVDSSGENVKGSGLC